MRNDTPGPVGPVALETGTRRYSEGSPDGSSEGPRFDDGLSGSGGMGLLPVAVERCRFIPCHSNRRIHVSGQRFSHRQASRRLRAPLRLLVVSHDSAQRGTEIFDKTAERPISPRRTAQVHMLNDIVSELDTAKTRSDARGVYRFREAVLVPVAAALPVGRGTTLAKNSLERCTVEQQPPFDMGVRNSQNQGCRCLPIADLPCTFGPSFAIGIRGDNDQVRRATALIGQVPQVVGRFLNHSSMTAHRASPIQSHVNPAFSGNPPNQCLDDLLVCKVFDEQRDITHRNPPS